MEKLIYPKIELSDQPTNHKDFILIENELNDWINVYCNAAGIDGSLDGHKLSYFSSRVYNYGSHERVLAVAKVIAFLFIADDIWDFLDAKLIRIQQRRLVEIAANDEIIPLSSDNWFEACFSDVWRNISIIGKDEWKLRFIESLENWFKTAEMEQQFRKFKKVPPLPDYLTIRPYSQGAQFNFAFMEFASNNYLSPKTLSNTVFHSLQHYARLVLFATNDLYSHRKEVKKGDVMNIIMVFEKEYGLTAQQAINKTVDFINENLKIFESVKKQLTSSLIEENIEFYVSYLETMIRGNYDFHFESKRYYI
ncbi:hypothetical protein B4U80_13534 [Leptotrombidium deliense]|uniref:Terpene synthase n=1 Tax=Leptotrombidium deliense TaxID=299467 RepID=A0A443S4U6_9ACAR|nr:hypothetical protein B4U80_13534 [Leptotrombidium deliense]